eukprot:3638963-Rhodomonas_salina.1
MPPGPCFACTVALSNTTSSSTRNHHRPVLAGKSGTIPPPAPAHPSGHDGSSADSPSHTASSRRSTPPT